MLQVLQAGQQHGLKAKVHVNQFNAIGAIPAAVNAGAISVDHLEVMDDVDYTA
jgi:imidazolonepropionase